MTEECEVRDRGSAAKSNFREPTHPLGRTGFAIPRILFWNGVQVEGRVEAGEVEGSGTAVAAEEVAFPTAGVAVVSVGLPPPGTNCNEIS